MNWSTNLPSSLAKSLNIWVLMAGLGLNACLFELSPAKPIDGNQAESYGSLRVEEKTGAVADIYINGSFTGLKTPAVIEKVPAGQVIVSLVKEGYETRSDTLQLSKGSILDWKASLGAVAQPVKLDLNPKWMGQAVGTKVYVDGLAWQGGTVNTGTRKVRVEYGTAVAETTFVLQAETQWSPELQPQQWAFLEHFSNVACIPCPSVDRALERYLVEADPRIVHVAFHINFPSAADPFYTPYKDVINQRIGMSYYQVGAAPLVLLNGQKTGNRQDSVNIPKYLGDSIPGKLSQNPSWHIAVDSLVKADKIRGVIQLQSLGSTGTQNTRLRAALVQKRLHMDVAPGINGLKDFEHLFRGFVLAEDLTGDLSQGQSFAFEQENTWQGSTMQLVVWVEDFVQKRILQVYRVDLAQE